MAFELDGWLCGCGYTNAGEARCIMCNAKAPAPVAVASGSRSAADQELPDEDWDRHDWRSYYAPTAASRKVAGGKATRTVLKLILVGIVVQTLATSIAVGRGMPPADAMKVGLFTGLIMYGIEALWVLARSADLGLRPRWSRADAPIALGEGVLVGGGLALALTLAVRLITGQPALDEVVAEMVSEGGLAFVLFGVVPTVVAAPLVEELVFRGFLAVPQPRQESRRGHQRGGVQRRSPELRPVPLLRAAVAWSAP